MFRLDDGKCQESVFRSIVICSIALGINPVEVGLIRIYSKFYDFS